MPPAGRLHTVARSFAVMALLGGCSAITTRSADALSETGELIALSGGHAGASSACFTCHGLDGLGNGSGAPRLAALDAGYLSRQLEAYADGRRRHPQMQRIAGRLSAQDRQSVSAYYARLPYRASGSTGKLSVLRLYHEGDPARGLPSCASCHGARGEGGGAANPLLGGQPAPYLAEQLHQWRQAKRRNDPGDVMLRISRQLTRSEVGALSAYASRLPGDQPHPAPPEASRATRRGDPRSGA